MSPRQAPSVSVVVRTLGGASHVADALRSLAGQTTPEVEAVVVDLSPRGDAMARVEVAPARLVHLRTGRRLSRPAALNCGIRAARAPVIGVLDDDNLYEPAHLERLLAVLDASGADYAYCGVRHVTLTADGERISSRDVCEPFDARRLLLGNFVYATGSAYRRSLWERLGGYDERFVVFEDWDFLVRAAQSGRIVHLPLVSGESRKFTGIEGLSTFDLEVADVRRCHAGLYWKHRRLFDRELLALLPAIAAEHCERWQPARPRLLARQVRGWRLELGWDLLRWWASTGPAATRPAIRGPLC